MRLWQSRSGLLEAVALSVFGVGTSVVESQLVPHMTRQAPVLRAHLPHQWVALPLGQLLYKFVRGNSRRRPCETRVQPRE